MNNQNTTETTIQLNLDDSSSYRAIVNNDTAREIFAKALWDEMDRLHVGYGDRNDQNATRFATAALAGLSQPGYVPGAYYGEDQMDHKIGIGFIATRDLMPSEKGRRGNDARAVLTEQGYRWSNMTNGFVYIEDDTTVETEGTVELGKKEDIQIFEQFVRPAAIALGYTEEMLKNAATLSKQYETA